MARRGDDAGLERPGHADGRWARRQARERPLGTRRQRGTQLARLSASTGASYVVSRVRGLGGRETATESFHAANAARIAELLGSMKGAAMKVGQIASFVDLDLPEDVRAIYQDSLSGLRESAPRVDAQRIAEVIAQDYGAPPEHVFGEWEREPLASASIGQVHRARLPDGTRVVTKVQHPGVAEAVEADLGNLDSLAPLLRAVSPNLDLDSLLDELGQRLLDELDYQREAQYQQAFVERYRGHPFIRIPRVYQEWCRPRVLVVEEMRGASLEEMAATADEGQRQRYAEILYRFYYGSLHRFQLFNADPHPGNYVFPGDGTVAFLDFGSVKVFPSAVAEAINGILDAVIADDREALAAVLRRADFVPAGYEPDWARLMAWFQHFHAPIAAGGEFTYTPEFATSVLRSTTDPRWGPLDILRRMNLPADYLLLNRIQWGINSILGQLRARADWQAIFREWRHGAEPATELGRQETAFMARRSEPA
jgi:predicted unusual protein kinase regulating ubiquinone biosynthesis (AarF/ABC1/UbiB family)